MKIPKTAFATLIFFLSGLFWGGLFQDVALANPGDAGKQKVVYQINDPNPAVVKYALSLIDRHMDVAGGMDKIDIKVIFHGPSLQLFQGRYTEPRLVKKLEGIIKRGIHPEVCQVTMERTLKNMNMFVSGMVSTPTPFGVERVVNLQMQGYRFITWSYPHEIVMRPDVISLK